MTLLASIPMPARVVAIDGPAGSGKSSTARAVADALDFAHLDSGALYRAFTLAAIDHDLPLDGERIAALAGALPVRLDRTPAGYRPEIAGVDVSEAVRSPAVTARVSAVAALPAVRRVVNAMVRAAAAEHPRGVVIEGRDIGTVVFADAGLKIFLTASPEERARRRLLQENRLQDAASVAREAETLKVRDHADANRPIAPLAQAPDAIPLDTTGMGFDEQVRRIVELARKLFP